MLLRDSNLSQRQIAAVAHVSRGSVANVLYNRHRGRDRPADDVEDLVGPPERCPECGCLVYMPCRLEIARRALACADKQPSDASRAIEPLGLDLHGEPLRRYQEIRRRRAIDQTYGAWREPAIANERSERKSPAPRPQPPFPQKAA
jgi:hypothetical protein